MTSSGGRYRRPWSEAGAGGGGGGGGGSVSTLKRLLSDLLQALQIQDSWRRVNSNSGRRQLNNSCQLAADITTVSSPPYKSSSTAAQ